MKKIIYSLMLISAISVFEKKVFASVTDQAASDMLTASGEDENVDQISRWGDIARKGRKAGQSRPAFTFSPIGESSLESLPQLGAGNGRAPASVGSSSPTSRGPAGAVDGVIIQATDKRASPKAVARAAVNKKAVQEVSIIANDYGFFPSTIFVTQGIPVRLFVTGASTRSNCFMLDSFGVRRQIRSQKIEEISFTPDQSGNFSFSCPMNGAKGSVVVKELEVGSVRAPASVETNEVASRDDADEAQSNFAGEKINSNNNDDAIRKSLIRNEDFGI